MMTSHEQSNLLRWANWLIYASVALGILLIAQLYSLRVSLALLIPLIVGWVVYLILAILVWSGHSSAYLAALILAIVTLAVSLPQPEHLSLAEAGATLASITFILGSILQLGVIVLIICSIIMGRSRSKAKT